MKSKLTYLNTGTSGQMPSAVQESLRVHYERYANNPTAAGEDEENTLGLFQEINREKLSKVFSVPIETLVITGNTTMGLHLAINGLEFPEGTEIVTSLHEHITLLSPLWVTENRNCGVKVVKIDIPEQPKNENEVVRSIETQIKPSTKLVCISHVNWSNGMRLPVSAICQRMRELGVKIGRAHV